MMMIHDNKSFITTPGVMNKKHRHHHHHNCHQVTEYDKQQQQEESSFPSLVKQLFTSLSCLQPAVASQGKRVMKKEQDEAEKQAARMYLATAADSFPDSVFLKMYFSFPALEEFESCNGSSGITGNKKKNLSSSSSSAAIEQCKRLLR
ncbi:hypothetical protein INT45_011737 [Circinella minor]|uniref:Uncharacterized protein n=1 Tax=Circinella minor TaxID=1195481 RepID=A0A8H7SAX9_9FUNG|nr:hypothetical protein INT45_011737 [Circinella minor]